MLTMERSSQSERSKYSILVNKLSRRFEMLDNNISTEERRNIVDHFCHQLLNSGYSGDKVREIVISGLKGIKRKEEKRKSRENRYRGASETLGERLERKLTEATNWYKNEENTELTEEAKVSLKQVEGNWKRYRSMKRKRKLEEKD